MDFSKVSQVSAHSTAPNTGASNLSQFTSDFETFLQMLTTQAKYQDPLKPIDSTEYASQLAQFSAVEQQLRSNTLLEQIATQSAQTDLLQIGAWVGSEVRGPASVRFSGAPVRMEPNIETGADRGVLLIQNAAGQTIRTLPFNSFDDQATWDGLTDGGSFAPQGSYAVEVQSWRGELLLNSTPLEAYGRVTEASLINGVPTLLLNDGRQISANTITAVRRPVGL